MHMSTETLKKKKLWLFKLKVKYHFFFFFFNREDTILFTAKTFQKVFNNLNFHFYSLIYSFRVK